MGLIKMKFIELKQNLVEFQAKHEENIQKLIKLLKQIETSAKFTGEKLRLYATPYLRSYMTKSMGYIGAAPVLVEDAVTYFAEAPEDSFWYGMEVTKEALTGAYAQAKTITTKDIEEFLFEFYTNVLALSGDIYVKTTDEWTKKTVLKLRELIKETLTKIIAEHKKLEDTLSPLVKAYYEKNVAILKDVLNGKFDSIEVPLKALVKALEDILAKEYAALKALSNKQLDSLKMILKDTRALVTPYTTEMIRKIKECVDTFQIKAFVNNKIWQEIIDEINNHELVVLTVDLVKKTVATMTDLKVKMLPIVEKFIKTQLATLEGKYAALKEKSDKMLIEFRVD